MQTIKEVTKAPTNDLSSVSGEGELVIAILANNKDKGWWNKYLDIIREAMIEFKIDENSPKIAMTTPKNHSMPISIGQRYVISSSIRSESIRMILPIEFKEVLSEYPQKIEMGSFNNKKGEEDAILVRFTSDIIFTSDTALLGAWKKAIADEMDRTSTSGFRKFHNPFYYKAVMDLNYREQLLNSLGIN